MCVLYNVHCDCSVGTILRTRSLETHEHIQEILYSRAIIAVSISWLPRVCRHEHLIKSCATRREKSIGVSFVSVSCSVCEL